MNENLSYFYLDTQGLFVSRNTRGGAFNCLRLLSRFVSDVSQKCIFLGQNKPIPQAYTNTSFRALGFLGQRDDDTGENEVRDVLVRDPVKPPVSLKYQTK